MPFLLSHNKKNDEKRTDSDGDMVIHKNINVNSSAGIFTTDDIVSVVESLEEQRCAIFDKAKTNTKKAEQHQAKGYNSRQAQGTPFAVGKKVLKHNLSKGKLEKMKLKYVRPYEILSRSENNLYTLKEKYSHVRFYDSKIYKVDRSTNLNLEVPEIPDMSCATQNSECTDSSGDIDSSCKCTNVYQVPQKSIFPVTSMPIKLQIIIMSSKENAFSSDELEVLSVGSEPLNFPFGNINMNIDDIEIEIVEVLNEDPLPTHFWPLGDDNRKIAALKFNLVINAKTHPVRQTGFGEIISQPPLIFTRAHGDGACPFHSLSILLTG